MHCSLALLCEGPVELARHAALLDELGAEVSGLILCAPALEPILLGAPPRPARLVASLYARGGLLGALQSALLVCSGDALLAVDAGRPVPPADRLRRLLQDPRPASALVWRCDGGLEPLPGRFRRRCLGSLSRALAAGEQLLAPVLLKLRCSTVDG